ncbi:hypothetical protein IWX49DRAFT_414714 [Phyllosticta citricarpa]|uniref:Uncharacterized protein n=1 Tax=Phyllosticta citricarpa TaxID=55181 RepID=A0ABR1M6Y0_9PEZI
MGRGVGTIWIFRVLLWFWDWVWERSDAAGSIDGWDGMDTSLLLKDRTQKNAFSSFAVSLRSVFSFILFQPFCWTDRFLAFVFLPAFFPVVRLPHRQILLVSSVTTIVEVMTPIYAAFSTLAGG